MRSFTLFLVTSLLLGCMQAQQANTVADQQPIDYNSLSERFLTQIKNGTDTQAIQEQLANITLADLAKTLSTDNQKIAFWVNIYNAYIQIILKEQPELYQDRSSFFSKDQIAIAGHTISFDKIEHGILRRSQSKIGFGYVRKGFPDKLERQLRVANPDYRIHFALNCGAKDCPPVAIYSPNSLQEQFKKGSARFLKQSSSYDPQTKEVAVTSLFSWFRGDFGGKSGIKTILKNHGIISTVDEVHLEFKDYDWTLYLDHFISL